MKQLSSPKRPFRRGNFPASSAVIFFLLFFYCAAMAAGKSHSKAKSHRIPKEDTVSIWPADSLLKSGGSAQGDSLSKGNPPAQNDSLAISNPPAQNDSLSKGNPPAQNDSLAISNPPAKNDSLSKKPDSELDGLNNIFLTQKNIRAYGWGEYRVMGRCLCCDNALDGDCILVQSTNRTDKIRIQQIVDGKIVADSGDKSTYFGDVEQRERPEPVSNLMVEITWKKMADVYKVIVYTMIDKEKKKNFLSNCELGYYDQFDRLQWAGKAESKWSDDRVVFNLQEPILTKGILLKVKGGKSRITEVALFGISKEK